MAILCSITVTGCAASSPVPSASSTPIPSSSPYPAATLGAFPELPDAALPERVASALRAALEPAVRSGEATAVAASVVVPGVGVWSGAAGEDASGERLAADAQFAIASVTKTVVAAQVLVLAEDGLLDLDAPIDTYLPPELGVDANGGTVVDFLAMRSGLAQIPDAAIGQLVGEDADRAVTLEEIAPLLTDAVAEPGERVEYNNLNYILLGAAIASVTGHTVGEALRSGVLSTGDLARLVYQDEERPQGPVSPPGPVEGVPDGTDLLEAGGGFLPTRAIATAAGAAGSMAADAATLARWGYLLYGGFVLQPESLAAMTDVSADYGLGCHSVDEFGLHGIGHSGSLPGYASLLYADASSGVIIAVLVNSNSWSPGITASDLLRALEDD